MKKPLDRRQPVISRRSLLAAGLAAPFAVHPSPAFAQDQNRSPNSRLNTAVIGIGERGKYLIANLPPAFRVTALCDCSEKQIETALKPPERFGGLLTRFAESDGRTCQRFKDYRRMLQDHRFDAVIISAPDHHHALAAILAMQSGAHVYVEKPLAVTIEEGRAIAKAATRYQRIVQVGSQQRTMEVNRVACEFIREGGLGHVHRVEERNLPGPMPYLEPEFPPEPIPESLEWDLFCGPTPRRAYNRHLWVKDAFSYGHLLWRGWDLFDDYSGHLMTNWGAHSVDMIQFALGKDETGPIAVDLLKDDIDRYVDDQWHLKTPPLGTLADDRVDRLRFCPLVMKYADGTEVHFKPGARKTTFFGERGKLELTRNDYTATPGDLLPPPDPIEQQRWSGSGHVARPHLENWLRGIEDGLELHAPPEVGHRSSSVCHLANIARRLGRSVRWDPERENFVGDPEADAWISRPRRAGFELPAIA